MAIDLRDIAPARNETIPDFSAGDNVAVHVRVVEGDRERIQLFEGTVLRVRKGYNGSFTVRRISSSAWASSARSRSTASVSTGSR